MARHASFLLKSTFDVSFDCLLGDIASARKLNPQNAIKVDNFVSTKRNKIQSWIVKNLNHALKLNKLKSVDTIPWKCLKLGKIQGYQIVWKGLPIDIVIQRQMPKTDCETVLALIEGNDIEIILQCKKVDPMQEMALDIII